MIFDHILHDLNYHFDHARDQIITWLQLLCQVSTEYRRRPFTLIQNFVVVVYYYYYGLKESANVSVNNNIATPTGALAQTKLTRKAEIEEEVSKAPSTKSAPPLETARVCCENNLEGHIQTMVLSKLSYIQGWGNGFYLGGATNKKNEIFVNFQKFYSINPQF